MMYEVDMEKTLRSVREAYRFLHEFQKRLSDTIERFRQEFRGYTYVYSLPIFTDRPLFTKRNQHEWWALDLFPAFAYGLQYKNEEPKNISSLLEIYYYSDSEFDEEKFDGIHGSLPGESKDSTCMLEVRFWAADQPQSDDINWREITDKVSGYEDTEYGEVYSCGDFGVKTIYFEIDIKDLIDEKSIIKQADRVKKIIKDQLGFAFDN